MVDNRVLLLIEDNADDEALTLRALEKNNILNEVVVARDGAEALTLLLGPPGGSAWSRLDRLAVILLDLKLPKVDGLEVLRRLRADPRTRRLPIVILTSSKEEKDLVGAYDLGCNSYVQKPMEFVEFVEAMRHLGVYWLLTNAPPPPERRR
jgi:two-component system response regulator